jgi:hypothetical protein
MKYVDSALSCDNTFSGDGLGGDYSLADYAKERDEYNRLGALEYSRSKEFGDGGFDRER